MRRLQIKFPNQIRISGWDFGSSARAMNQAGGKDSLITYECEFPQAVRAKYARMTFERKIMSTKTSIKRIALVAVASLGFGLVASTPSQAAVSVTYSSTYDTTNGVGIVGGTAVATYSLDTNTSYSIVAGGVGQVLIADPSDTNTDWTSPVPETGGAADVNAPIYNFTSGSIAVGNGGTSTIAFTLTSNVAGTQTITLTPITSGIPGTAVVKSFTWVAAADTTLSDSKTLVGLVSSTAACKDSGSAANDASLMAAYARSTISYRDTSGNRGLYLCIIARDGQGNIIDNDNIDSVIVSSSNASFASGSVDRYSTLSDLTDADSAETGANDGAVYGKLYGDGLAKGAGTISVSITEGAVTVVRSLAITQYGKIATVTATQSNYALAADSDGADYTNSSDKNGTAIVASIVCKDSLGTTVPGCDYDGDGSYSSDSGDTGAMYLVVDSDQVTGTPAFSASSPASASELGVSTFTIAQSTSAVGLTTLNIVVDNDLADAGDVQKQTIHFYIKDASETTPTAKISTSVVFYNSDSASTVEVTVGAEEVAVGGTTTVQVSVKDENGYPVEDGTAVTVVATNGSVITGGSSSTTNGAFATAKTFVSGDQSASANVVASVGSKSGSKKIAITGVSAASDSVDAANEATDAANAATDAANAAAEAADAATAAAQDAQAAVAELATKVASLMAGIKAQITSLTNLVIKIQKKVKA